MKTLADRFVDKYEAIPEAPGCWIWTASRDRLGYGRIGYKDSNGRVIAEGAHRAAWLIFRGPIPDDLHVLHRCHTRACVNPGHLYLGTHQENMKDRDRAGRVASGERNGRHKFGSDIVAKVRERIVVKGDVFAVAKELGISPTHAAVIACGVWRRIG